MQFTRLRLTGFKSFVENTDLAIEPGLSGVVGPNGCGKSNIIEALRWVMGETSARQMRGGEMDDVIFGGTDRRAPRNFAEVSLELLNDRKTAPAAFNGYDDIVIRRRIERGKGSDYRVNGKSVRARDVHLLFADAATGARSPGIVSQGRIGAIVNAKPQERRQVLEDAAGITGLHSRRHEAELRLKAAEGNLERLEDVVETMDKQLAGLKKQAQQASRYRRLSEDIRKVEARLFLRRWEEAAKEAGEAAEALRVAEREVADFARQVTAASTHQADRANAMPQLRAAEADAAAALQRLTLAQRDLESEAKRIAGAQHHARQRLDQLAKDIDRESRLADDAREAIGRLDEEAAKIAAAQDGEEADRQARQEAADKAQEAAATADGAYAEIDNRIAAADATRRSLDRQIAEARQRADRLSRLLAESQAKLAAAESALPDAAALEAARGALAQAEEKAQTGEEEVKAAEAGIAMANEAEEKARTAHQAAVGLHTGVKAEVDALTKLIRRPFEDASLVPVLDYITVELGYEHALAAALGDDLNAPAGDNGAKRWQGVTTPDDEQTLPEGVDRLDDAIQAPPELARRLGQVGLVIDLAAGLALVDRLRPGQRLVTRNGDMIRWDGFIRESGAPSESAVRLEQRNRLNALEKDLEKAAGKRQRTQAALDDAKADREAAVSAHKAAREALKRKTDYVTATRQQLDRLGRDQENALLRLEQAKETAGRARADAEEAATTLDGLTAHHADLGSDAGLKEERDRRRDARDAARQKAAEARRALDDLTREIAARTQRHAQIEDEKRAWRTRSGGAGERLSDLEGRRAKENADLERLEGRPAEIDEKRRRVATQIKDAEDARWEAADLLAKGETLLAEADKALKELEAGMQAAREARVRAESRVEQTAEARRSLAERIQEKLDCRPGEIRQAAQLDGEEELGREADLAAQLEKLVRSRDAIGPVNLRAEAEVEEVETQIAGMATEREDLIQAIARLRQGISALNKEGRERLNLSFNKVDTHFRTLFTRLFGGGQARLEMIETDDPLNAGLEILASPPGKKMQSLSLLSGGEQALTALALIFAVFLTNPAPICVLDEVDAPLDDSNVDRFCTLLEEIARTTGTRFLVITHHRMTMARMDRLFGVTMAERGVSTLVSVDLGGAVQIRDSKDSKPEIVRAEAG
ncbi:MAG: chromosome segregation protein SMC [Alphaproteobacteria bacterium]|nr:chromosome segregation protein SMC [Alphaproteobacteria bacterium]